MIASADDRGNAGSYPAWYTRCPDCGLVGPAGSAEYVLTGPPGSAPDWSQPVSLGCTSCERIHEVGLADLLPHDVEHACSRCRTVLRVPAAAAEVVCTSCHLHAPGPAAIADQAVADKRQITQKLHALELHERLLAAKQRRGLR